MSVGASALRTPAEALSELREMTRGQVAHQWVTWNGGRWLFTSFDGFRSGALSTETELMCGLEPSGGIVLLDGRIARCRKVVGHLREISFTGEAWT